MQAYLVANDIVAAESPAAALVAWAAFRELDAASAGRCEALPSDFQLMIEQEDGSERLGTLAEVMPPPGSPAEIIAEGYCGGCPT